MKRRTFWTLHGVCTTALLVALILLLAGCATQHSPRIDEAFVHVKIVDEPGADWPPRSAAITRWAGNGVSQIEILRGYYPECVTHEVRHVFEGDWHPDGPMHCR